MCLLTEDIELAGDLRKRRENNRSLKCNESDRLRSPDGRQMAQEQ